MIDFIIGLVVGAGITYHFFKSVKATMEERIKDYEHFANTRINDVHNSFARGYETRNGFKPYQEVDREPETVVMSDEVLYEMENANKPVEDTYSERDFHQTRD